MSGGTAARLTCDRRRTEDGQLLGGRWPQPTCRLVIRRSQPEKFTLGSVRSTLSP